MEPELPPTITSTRARLVQIDPVLDGPRSGQRVYRPLVIRPAILFRPAGSDDSWHVDVEGDLLLPACPSTEQGIVDVVRFHETFGRTCRIAVALALPADGRSAGLGRFTESRRRRIDMFGWAIMIQRPGMTGTAVVDRHEHRATLPAFYECPLQLLDRSEFLTSRGIRHRPLAVVVRPEDVEGKTLEHEALGHGRSRSRHRPRPERDGPTPCSIADLLGP
jgi:hypothetical protein